MTTLTTTSTVTGLLPPDFGPLLIEPLRKTATCLDPRVSTTYVTGAHTFHMPLLTADGPAAFVAEGDEITPGDATIGELVITPAKAAALRIISSELANDTNPAAQVLVGESLAQALADRLDSAFFGSAAAPAPSGLAALAGVTTVVAGAAPVSLDAFSDAMLAAETVGTEITAWCANPADAATLSKIKAGSALNSPLLGTGVENGPGRVIFGVPVVVSPKVVAGVHGDCQAPGSPPCCARTPRSPPTPRCSSPVTGLPCAASSAAASDSRTPLL